jgi:protein tyrosine phosphatase (PTP) superfamily phosphohydrolase (DUF442 family)
MESKSLCLVVSLLLGLACALGGEPESRWRLPASASQSAPARLPASHPAWAVPLSLSGLPNLCKVSDCLYRGAQPEAEGYPQLKKLGIRTVISLRSLHGEAEQVTKVGMQYRSIPMEPIHPEDEDIVAFLKIVSDKKLTPVFVHCQHGSDRTGMLVAAYRIFIDGWTKEQAIEEMSEGETGFHAGFQNLLGYLRRLDVAKIRQQAALDR